MLLENILSGQMVERIGWTLIHFLWQGAALAVVLLVELALLRKSKANVRYIAACVTLALMALVPLVTLFAVPVSESGFENAGESRAATLGLETEYVEPVEVVTLTEAEPIAPENVTPAAAPAIAPVRPSYSWKEWADGIFKSILPYLVLGWLIGVFGLSVWHLGGWAQLQRLRRRMVKPVGASLHSKLRELSELLGVHRAVQLMESALVRVPMVVGWLRPVILLPASALTGLTREQLEALLAHELAHIRRYDYLVNMLQTVVEILGFYHPAVWWVSHKIRLERENCCDDLAVRVCGDKVRYARALASMEEIRGGRAALAVAANGVSLLGRIRRLVGKSSRESRRCSWIPAVIAILLILAIGISTTLALTAQTREKADMEVVVEDTSQSKFSATLPSGVRVELVGVCEHPSEGKQWWRPDGGALDVAPYDKVGGKVFPDGNERACEFAVRLAGLPTGLISTKMKTDPSGSATAGGSSAPKKAGRYMRDFRWMAASLKKKWKSCTVRFGIAAGDWKTIAARGPGKRPGQWGSSLLGRAEGSVAFSDAVGLDGQTQVTVTHDILEKDFRIVAVDQTGREYTASQSDGHATDSFNQVTLSFELALDDVRGFRVQIRPYEWVEFRDVSLKPGVKTDVEVEVGGARAEKEEDEQALAVLKAMVEEARKVSDRDKVASEKTRREEIAKRVAALEDHRDRIQRDLDVAEHGLEDVRRRWGITDLEERSYPHPITSSLSRFQQERDNCVLETHQLQAEIRYLEEKLKVAAKVAKKKTVGEQEARKLRANLEPARERLKVVQSKLEALERLVQETREKKRELDEARVRYERRLAIRDERREMLDSIKEQIEKMKIMHDDPEPSPVPVRVYEREDEREKAREGRRLSRKEIRAKLENLEKQRNRVQRDLQAVEHAMDDVRRSSGFTDLEERSYPHPVTSRVIRLERQRDDCVLEIAQLQAKIHNLEREAGTAEGKANLKKAQDDLVVLTRKLEQLQVMREEAAAKKRDLDLARVQYKKRLAIRDERKRMLDSLKSEIEKLRIMHDDPETPETKTEDKMR